MKDTNTNEYLAALIDLLVLCLVGLVLGVFVVYLVIPWIINVFY